MRSARTGAVLVIAVCMAVTIVSQGQTKPASGNDANTHPGGAQKTTAPVKNALPVIKCTDRATAEACKSFKQLVDARDKGILLHFLGNPNFREPHYAYVCFRPGADTFSLVEFSEPRLDEFKPYSPAAPGDNQETMEMLDEAYAFPEISGRTELELFDIRKKWYEEHEDSVVYAFGTVTVDKYQDGILADFVFERGKWSQPRDRFRTSEQPSFEGAYAWLTRHSKNPDGPAASHGTKDRADITVGEESIFVRYSFKNSVGTITDYVLNLQRSTGRFTESFKAEDGDPFDKAGNCMIFKQ